MKHDTGEFRAALGAARPGDVVEIPNELLPEATRHMTHRLIRGGTQMTQSSAALPRIISDAEIDRRFTYHPPTEEKARLHKMVNDEILSTAKYLRDCTPAGREQSLMITALEEVRFRANQAIATGEE